MVDYITIKDKKVEYIKPDLIIYSVVEDCYMQCLSLLDATNIFNIQGPPKKNIRH